MPWWAWLYLTLHLYIGVCEATYAMLHETAPETKTWGDKVYYYFRNGLITIFLVIVGLPWGIVVLLSYPIFWVYRGVKSVVGWLWWECKTDAAERQRRKRSEP